MSGRRMVAPNLLPSIACAALRLLFTLDGDVSTLESPRQGDLDTIKPAPYRLNALPSLSLEHRAASQLTS